MSYDNNNRGAIWKNDDKQKDTHPDFRGKATINNIEYFVSAWKRTSDNPKAPALSFQFQSVEEVNAGGVEKASNTINQPAQYDKPEDDIDDDIPF